MTFEAFWGKIHHGTFWQKKLRKQISTQFYLKVSAKHFLLSNWGLFRDKIAEVLMQKI